MVANTQTILKGEASDESNWGLKNKVFVETRNCLVNQHSFYRPAGGDYTDLKVPLYVSL